MSSPVPPAGRPDTPPGSPPRIRWLRGAGWLASGSVAALGLSAVAGILLARFLGPRQLGFYAAVTVATSLTGALSMFGLDLHLATVLRHDDSDSESYAAVLQLGFLVSLAATAIGEIVAWLAFAPHQRLPIMIDLGEVALGPVVLRQVVLQIRGQQRSMVFSQMLNRATWVLVVLVVIATSPPNPVAWLMGGRVGVLCLQGAALAVLARFPGERSSVRVWRPSELLATLRASAPIAFSALLGTGYNRVDQLLLTAIRGSLATGLYAGGVRLAELPGAIPAIVQNVSLPTLVQVRRTGREGDVSRVLHNALLLTIVPGGMAVALLAGLGRPLVVLVLGHRFAGAATVVVILAAADWARLPATVYMSLALANSRRRALVLGTSWGFVVNIVVNLALIPFLGATAAAIASLLAYGCSAVLIAWNASPVPSSNRSSYVLTARLGVPAILAALVGHAVHLPILADGGLIVFVYLLSIAILLPAGERRRLARDARALTARSTDSQADRLSRPVPADQLVPPLGSRFPGGTP